MNATTANAIAHLTASGEVLTWDDLAWEDRRDLLLGNPRISEWYDPEALDTLVHFRPIPQEWAHLKARYKEYRGDPFDLQKAVDALRQLAPEPVEAQPPVAPLAASLVSFTEMLALKLEPRKPYMDWLTERSLVMVYGPRGVGKTMALLGLSVSLATHTPFLKWAVSQPVGVLYVDGEMSLEELRTRAVALAGGHIPTRMAFLPSELVYARSGHDLTLTCEHRRQEVEAMLEARPDLRVLVLDNVSCLFPGISEDKKQDWEPINAWFIRLRHRGLTVLFGHHAGKGGQQRGTSGREDALDVVLALTRPPGRQAKDGCHFHLRFEKSRGVKGQTVEDLDVRLEETPEGFGWTQAPLEYRRQERIRDMLLDGMPPRGIADELGITASYVYRRKREMGL
jgi:hypothetical protein